MWLIQITKQEIINTCIEHSFETVDIRRTYSITRQRVPECNTVDREELLASVCFCDWGKQLLAVASSSGGGQMLAFSISEHIYLLVYAINILFLLFPS